MRVVVRCAFLDRVAGLPRESGAAFECDEKRARHLVALDLVEIVEEQPVEQPKKAASRAKREK